VVERFHHISTCEVFGDLALDSDEVFTEESPYRPRTPYNASKAAADHYVRAYHETYGLPVTITNCSNNYGPYQFPEKVLPLFVTNALDGEALPVYGDGRQTRDWLHVEDHCAAVELVLREGEAGEVYNVGAGHELENIEVTRRIVELTAADPSLVRHVTDRPGHDRRYSLDSSKIAALGWRPERTFDDGLAETVAWYRDRRDWWEPLKSGEYREYYRRQYADRLA
jgi:dTDP-glucose 4,6-dehydratase